MFGVSLDDVKKKWKNLRSQYMRELRIQKNSKKSGSGVNDLYEAKLWCFDQLSFLEGHVATRQSQDNTEMPSSSNSSNLSTANSTETGSKMSKCRRKHFCPCESE
ncbi:uncharacterized protein LOC128855130 [Anastrepha ludens]|uniref:uncharacterized protein LOC128855130 n=1 Tax=Anastrepha ludens TaxID=28586 RepID=UPI0023B174F1|nr:uncharacterized protein LOC128855130 [Anastrepha ludens]